MNQQIRAKEVRLIGSGGEQIGIVPIEKARELAQEEGLDLVEVAPQASPPVCKIEDYKRLAYEQKKRIRDQRKKARTQELKEIKMKPNTAKHDFEFKLNRARDFLEKGHKVKLTVTYRGREMAHFDRGTGMLNQFVGELGEVAEVESRPSSRGRMQSMVIAPQKRAPAKKTDKAPAGAEQAGPAS